VHGKPKQRDAKKDKEGRGREDRAISMTKAREGKV
jgi:hypothetical protein